MDRSGAAGEQTPGATGLVEAPRTGVWSPGSGLRLGAAWPVTLGVLAPSLPTLDSRAQNQEAEGWWPGLPAGSDVWQIWFPECLGMMTTQFPSADGRDGCDFRIHLAVTHTHTHTHTLRSWGLCFHDPERATVPGDPLRPRLPPSGVQPKLQ